MKNTEELLPKSKPNTTNPKLPDRAMEFLRLIDTSRQPNTRISYGYSLRQFFALLSREDITEETLNRSHIESWLKELKERGLSPATRCIRLLMTRAYLRWLRDSGDVNCEADKLIRNSDFPKIPSRLPRPLPPALDAEIQNRLERSLCPHHHALLLMRRTGLRIGEVVSLSFNCLYIDSNKRAFLKVPLGKLHNERLVPLDDKTVDLIRKIQSATQKKAQDPKPPCLVRSRVRENISVAMLRIRFEQIVGDLRKNEPDPINPHRFRHSYATELLNAGMSLESVMTLLGHRSIESTLRYAAVTQKSILEEYQIARKNLHNTYGKLTERFFDFESPSPLSIDQSLTDMMTLLQNEQKELLPSLRRKTNRILARLRRLKGEIQTLLRDANKSKGDKNRYKKGS